MAQSRTNAEVWDSISLDLISIQVEGKIVFINKAGADLLGATTPEQIIGKSILDFVHPDYQEIAIDRVCQMVSGDAVIGPTEERWIRLDGKPIDVEVIAMLLVYQGRPAVQFIARHDSTPGSRKPTHNCRTAFPLRGSRPRKKG